MKRDALSEPGAAHRAQSAAASRASEDLLMENKTVLIFLDSIQTNNLGNIANYVTLPEIVYFLARQTWDEALHSRSYGHILQNMM